jgi:hypothetical protein
MRIAAALFTPLLAGLIAIPAAAQTTIDADTTWDADQVFAGTLTVAAGVTVTVTGNVQVTADALVVEDGATINANGSGYTAGTGPGAGGNDGDDGGGGAGHARGGQGGSGTQGPGAGGSWNDNPLAPVDMGSGGGNGCNGTGGGRGGGAVRFVVAGQCTHDGAISANGNNGSANGVCGGGGGSGGTVSFTCGDFTSTTGTASADGGDGGSQGSSDKGGSGSGGLIAVRANTISITDDSLWTVAGGNGAGVGSVALYDVDDNALTVARGFIFRAAYGPFSFSSFTANDVNNVVNESAITALDLGATTLGAGTIFYVNGNVAITGTTLTVEADARFDGDRRGYARTAGPNPGVTDTNDGGGGGGHGGRGGNGVGTQGPGAGGAANDAPLAPIDMGSGGGNGCNSTVGGYGGAALRFAYSGQCTIDGTVRSDGGAGSTNGVCGAGGGAGGTISFDCAALTSTTGVVRAHGGSGGSQPGGSDRGGGGGGGRVVVVAADISIADETLWTVTAGAGSGQIGTVGFYDDDDDALRVREAWDLRVVDAPHAFASFSARDAVVRAEGIAPTLTATSQSFVTSTLTATGDVVLDAGAGGISLLGSTFTAPRVHFVAGTLLVDDDSLVNTNGRGWGSNSGPAPGGNGTYGGAGAGHGGRGARGEGSNYPAGGGRYDLAFAPDEPGSGGGRCNNSSSPGGAGGGVVTALISGTCTIDGMLSANGNNGSLSSDRGAGGGSGGSVRIDCAVLAGEGGATAKGGRGGANNWEGGGGSGGRVVFLTDDASSYTGGATIDVSAGLGFETAQPGSAAVYDRTDDALWVYDGFDFLDAEAPHTYASIVADGQVRAPDGPATVSFTGDASFTGFFNAATTLDLTVGGALTLVNARFHGDRLTVAAGSASIDEDSWMSVSSRGHASASGPAPGVSTNANESGGGGGHGGRGGTSGSNYAGGGVYDDPFMPTEYGSGGGVGRYSQAAGGRGGGAIRLAVTGALVHDGALYADGAGGASIGNRGGGGGAGGSIWVSSATLEGRGFARARGGLGGYSSDRPGGDGAGGRIAFITGSGGLFNPRASTSPTNTRRPGETGTVVVHETSTGDLVVVTALDLYTAGSPFAFGDVRVFDGQLRLDGDLQIDASGDFAADQGQIRVTNGRATINAAGGATFSAGGGTGADLDFNAASFTLAGSTFTMGFLELEATGSITIDEASRLNGNGRGYAQNTGPSPGTAAGDRAGAGAGHGGAGGSPYPSCCSGAYSTAGGRFGEAYEPIEKGSGGGWGRSGSAPGGTGGGVVRLIANGAVFVDALVTVNGNGGGSNSNRGGGGGAGGAILIEAPTTSGLAVLQARGGNGGGGSYPGGGGGGGRVLVRSENVDFPRVGQWDADGGTGYGGGGRGSAAILHPDSGWLQILEGWRFDADNANGGDATQYVYSTISVRDDAVIWVAPEILEVGATVLDDDGGIWRGTTYALRSTSATFAPGTDIHATENLNIEATGRMDWDDGWARARTLVVKADTLTTDFGTLWDVSARGWPMEQGPGAGARAGDHGGTGGSYGGKGNTGEWCCAGARPPAAASYGSASAPTEWGSGGGRSQINNNPATLTSGGAGGGAIRVEATTSFRHHGEARANGGNANSVSSRGGGGGAGGSVFVLAGDLSGAGKLVAAGGRGGDGAGSRRGGGGGGGRVFVQHASGGLDSPGASHANGGFSYAGRTGGRGTTAFHHVGDASLRVADGWDFQADATLDRLVVMPDSAVWSTASEPITLTITDDLVLERSTFSGTAGLTINAGRVDLRGSTMSSSNDLTLDVTGDVELREDSRLRARRVAVSAADMTIDFDSDVNVDGLGWPSSEGPTAGVDDTQTDYGGGGGGHGGRGGRTTYVLGGPEGTDDPLVPTELGSGGGIGRPCCGGAAGGAGGGAVRLDLTGTLTLSGLITASGYGGANNADRGGGGGAGGSIWVTTSHLEGGGTLRSNGGNGGATGRPGGGGGGGRIAVYYDTSTFDGTDNTRVVGGSSNYQAGEAGSAIFVDNGSGDLFIGGGMTFQSDRGPFSFRDVTTQPGSLVRLTGDSVRVEATGTVTSVATRWRATNGFEIVGDAVLFEDASLVTGEDLRVSAGDLFIDASSRLDTSARGFPASTGPGAGGDTASDRGGGGGGHGGRGGNSSGSGGTGGVRYGDDQSPIEAGSGGGYGWGGNVTGGRGGGVVALFGSRTIIVDGTVNANGGTGTTSSSRGGGGGAGGSIRLETGDFSGTGLLSARGANGLGSSPYNGGGGGGGRVSLCFVGGGTEAMQPIGIGSGTGYTNGEGGTLFVDDDCNRPPEVADVWLEYEGLPLAAGAVVPAGWPLTFVVRASDANGPADVDEVRLLPIGSTGPAFVWDRGTDLFSSEGDDSLVTLDASASAAVLDGGGFAVRFVVTPSFGLSGDEQLPQAAVTDVGGFVDNADADSATWRAATALRISALTFFSEDRELLDGDWIRGDAEIRATGRVSYDGVGQGPPVALGVAVDVVDNSNTALGGIALDDEGGFDVTFDAPSSDVSLAAGLRASTLPSGASEVDRPEAISLQVDANAPTVVSLTTDPPRLAASYVGPVRFVLTLTDAESGTSQALQRIDLALGSGSFDGDELMAPLGDGRFSHELSDRSFGPYGGTDLRYRIRAADLAGNEVVVEDAIDIDATNEAPTVTSMPPTTAIERTEWVYDVVASDAESDPLRYVLVQSPAGMRVDAAGQITWVPGYDQLGDVDVTLRVLDALGASVDQSFTVTVAPLDADGDGMPDTWERAVGLNPQVDDADGDADGDQRTNLSEFLEGTDPVSNRAPGAPRLVAPAQDAIVDASQPVLQVAPATDPEGDVLTYLVELYSDAALSELIESQDDVSDDGELARFVVLSPLPDDQPVWWRARAFDGVKYGPYSDIRSFVVDADNDAPRAPRALAPLDGGHVASPTPLLVSSTAYDAEGDAKTYDFEVYADESLSTLVADMSGVLPADEASVEAVVSATLTDGETYWWRARATDEPGASGPWSAASSFVVDTALSNRAPGLPGQLTPVDGEVVITFDVPLVAENTTDLDGDRLSYRFEVDADPCFCTEALAVVADVPEGASGLTRAFPQGLEDAKDYLWRVRAEDGDAPGPWAFTTFRVLRDNRAPSVPRIQAPADRGEADADGQLFSWLEADDPEDGTLVYDVEILDVTGGVANVALVEAGVSGSVDFGLVTWDPMLSLEPGHTYAWRVQAVDDAGNLSGFSDVATFSVYAPSLPNRPPTGLQLLSPIDGTTVATATPILEVRNAVDPDGEALRYTFEVYADQDLTSLTVSAEVNEGAGGSTKLLSPEALTDGETYWWRAQVTDGFAPSEWTQSERFTVRLFVAPPPDELPPDPEEDAGPPAEDGGVSDGGDAEPPDGCPCGAVDTGTPDASLVLFGVFTLVALLRRRRQRDGRGC